jgi:hypothetical protein
MKTIHSISIVFLLLIFSACTKSGEVSLDQLTEESFNNIILNGETYMPPEAEYSEEDIPYSEDQSSNGAEFLCNGKRVKEVLVIDNLTLNAFDDRAATNTAALYPGSIIKVKDFVEQNDLSGIGGIDRAPIEVSSDLGDIRLVEDPSQRGNVDRAIKEIEQDNPTFAANVKSESTEAYSLEQSMLHVGVDVRYLGNSVKGRFDFSQSVEKHSFVVKFHQVYHTASVANPGTFADLFSTTNHPDDIQKLVDEGGPLGLITEVAYGRMLIGIFTYEGSSYSQSSEIEAKFRKGFLSVEGELDQEAKGFFANSSFKVAILGGDAQEASAVAGSGLGLESIQSAYKWMRDGGNDPSLGVPIQYKIRQLSDPSFPLLAISGAVEYDVPDCNKLPNHVIIKDIEVSSLPPYDEENGVWDPNHLNDDFKNPDVYMIFQKYKSNDWQWLAGFKDQEWKDITSSQLPKTLGINIPIKEEDFNLTYNVQFLDNDEYIADLLENNGGYDVVGNINFNFRPHIRTISRPEPDNPYPTKITVAASDFTYNLYLEWSTQ